MRELLGGIVVVAVISIVGCQDGQPIPEGGCFPTGPNGDDYAEADAFCEEVYCPQTECQDRVVADAYCERPSPFDQGNVCSCECCDPQPDVGGTASSPEVWEEVYSCLLTGLPCEQDTAVTLALVQSGACGETVEWTITDGPGTGFQYSGTLSGTSLSWQSLPGTPEESGCWAFSEDLQRFNKLSEGAGFQCIGAGSRGASSTPATLPTCTEIEAANIGDFTACPPAPPQSPID